MEDELTTGIEYQEIKKRSVSAVVALMTRTFAIQIISFVATLLLTYYLDPAIYGVFYLVSSVVNFLAYFSDIGLAAALIQKHDAVTKEDLATTFTIQQILVLLALVILFTLSPFIQKQYGISQDGINLLYAMGVSFFLSSLKTIPSIMLEREIKFNKLIIPQILETLIFNFVAVYFAWQGFGVNSFTYAVLSRGVVGLIAVYFVYPWKPILGIYKNSLKSLLKFGLPYQANTFLAVLKDDGMTILLTKIIGASGLGYIGWASKWAGLPLRVVMDNLSKVSFPTFARLQNDKEKLTRAVEINLKYTFLAIFPLLVLMAFIAKPLATQIPRYQKWLPAIIPLYLYLYNSAWASISTSLTNLLNATGKIKITFKLMVMWTGLTWTMMPLFALKFGYLGVAYATAIIATSSLVTVIMAKKVISLNLFNALKTPLFSSLIMSLFLFSTLSLSPHIAGIFILGAISLSVYLISVLFFEGRQFFQNTFNYFKLKHA